jgi:anti-sigma factor RsiW
MRPAATNPESKGDGLTCPEARTAIQVRLDGSLPADSRTALAGHLRRCPTCRAYEADLRAIRDALPNMAVSMPDTLRREITGIPDRDTTPGRAALAGTRQSAVGRLRWRHSVAAAAALALVAVGIYWIAGLPRSQSSDADLARAARELAYVLAITDRALGQVQDTAIEGVLVGEVASAVKQIRIPSIPSTLPPIGTKTNQITTSNGSDNS